MQLCQMLLKDHRVCRDSRGRRQGRGEEPAGVRACAGRVVDNTRGVFWFLLERMSSGKEQYIAFQDGRMPFIG